MNILILYATMEGQTGKVAHFVAETARAMGHEAHLVDTEGHGSLDFDGVDAVVLAAPVHQRRHPRGFEAILVGRREELAARRVLMLSVSLSAAFDEGMEEAGEYLIEMKMRTGLEPDDEMLVAGAVRMGEYDYFAKQVVRFVVMRGRDYDDGADEHEFTDWNALAAKVKAFLAA